MANIVDKAIEEMALVWHRLPRSVIMATDVSVLLGWLIESHEESGNTNTAIALRALQIIRFMPNFKFRPKVMKSVCDELISAFDLDSVVEMVGWMCESRIEKPIPVSRRKSAPSIGRRQVDTDLSFLDNTIELIKQTDTSLLKDKRVTILDGKYSGKEATFLRYSGNVTWFAIDDVGDRALTLQRRLRVHT
jgi:hypothetical protein